MSLVCVWVGRGGEVIGGALCMMMCAKVSGYNWCVHVLMLTTNSFGIGRFDSRHSISTLDCARILLPCSVGCFGSL